MSETKKQQVIALGRLGWSARRIEAEAEVHRETASKYLKEAGVAVRAPGASARHFRKSLKFQDVDMAG